MRRYLSPCLFAAVAFISAFLLLNPSEAKAGERLHFGLDGDLVLPINEPGTTGSFGLGGRIGWRVAGGPIFLQPEMGLNVQSFSYEVACRRGVCPTSTDTMGRLMFGARAGFRGLVQPQLLFHVGYAFGNPANGLAIDVGPALDIKVRSFSFGLHGTYNYVADKTVGGLSWFDIGPHVGLTFL